MDRRERLNDPEEATRAAQDGHQARIWTSLPGIIKSFDPATQTATVQPTIQGIFQSPDGSEKNVNMPLLLDVPVEFPSGGGYTLTFPVAAGDECMIDFSARCIDAWWQSGGIQPQAEQRMHDLSDAVARVGVRSQARPLSNISTTSAQLRSDDGTIYVDLAAAQLTLKHPTKVVVDAPEAHFTGKITTAENVETAAGKDVKAGSISLKNHVHSGVAAGGANSGPPVP